MMRVTADYTSLDHRFQGNAISQPEQTGPLLFEKLDVGIIHLRSARAIPSHHFLVCRKATGLPSGSKAVTRMPNG
jgi:hypothetical protein